ncbi:MAG: AhpC/TSA family protein [Saprospiraceae bacterium]|nr:AhpC/TSA family protein [Saprospiraceae bacterium]
MRSFIFLLLVFATLFSCGASGSGQASAKSDGPAENTDFKVQLNGLNSGQVYLIGFFAEQSFRADSANIANDGTIIFKRDEPLPAGFYYVYDPVSQAAVQLLLDKDQTFTFTADAADIPNTAQVDGNLDVELLYQNLKFEGSLQPQFQEIAAKISAVPEGSAAYEQYKATQDSLVAARKGHLQDIFDTYPNSFFTKFKYAGQNPEIVDVRLPNGELDKEKQVAIYRRQMFDNVDFEDERLLRTPVVFNKLKRTFNELTPQNPDSINAMATHLAEQAMDSPQFYKFIVNWITLNYEPTKTTLMDSEAVYVHMITNYFTYDRAFWSDSAQVYALQLRANEMAASLVGKTAPDVQAPNPDGELKSISEITAPYIIVYMYNPTCEHCMEETPKLVKFYEEWKSKGVEVFAIAVDTEDQEWKDYIKATGMNWINVFDPTNKAIYAKYFVDITPEIYVINPQRTIIAKNLKTNQIEEIINKDKENNS